MGWGIMERRRFDPPTGQQSFCRRRHDQSLLNELLYQARTLTSLSRIGRVVANGRVEPAGVVLYELIRHPQSKGFHTNSRIVY
jgi:hypothetical protein